MLQVSSSPSPQFRLGQDPKVTLAQPKPLSFCDLPLEGTNCSSQQGNKRSPLAPDLPSKTEN